MTDQDSTILVMGPRGAGKSKFIELLAGPTKLRPNGDLTDSPRTISVSPYFTDGKTIKLVKFPGFDESDTVLTYVKLFIGIATFLGLSHRRGERVSSIIYLHPITANGSSKVPDPERNVTMLRRIAKDAEDNIVVVTTGWEQISESDTDSNPELELPVDLTGDQLDDPLRHNGTKLSALSILNSATKKTPKLLDLKDEIPAYTGAGKALMDRISKLKTSNQEAERKEGDKIKKEKNMVRVKELQAKRKQYGDTLTRLRNEERELEAPISWEQATTDNDALERAIKGQRDSATKDWKVEYDKKVAENKLLLDEKNAKVAAYDLLLKEKNALQTEVDTHLKPLSVAIRAKQDYAGGGDLFAVKTNDLFYVAAQTGPDKWTIARNSAGRLGAVYTGYFTK